MMKLSEFIEKYGDCEVTEEMEKCIIRTPKTVWDLKEGDICYYFENDICAEAQWGGLFLSTRRSMGLLTLTKEEANFKIECMKVYEEVKRFAKDFTDEEWANRNISKWCIMFSYSLNKVIISNSVTCKSNQLFFESKEKAEEAITAVGEERVKKYYLGVEQ